MVRQLFAYALVSVGALFQPSVASASRSKSVNQPALLTQAISAPEFLSSVKIKIMPLICYMVGFQSIVS